MSRIALFLVVLMVGSLVACGDDDVPEATPTMALPTRIPFPTSAPVPTPAPTAVPTPRPGEDTAPQGTQTGDAAIDAILAPLIAGDTDGLVPFFRLTDTACTQELGVGGPPKCSSLPGNPPEGTAVQAFPTAGCEGGWTFDVREVAMALLAENPRLFGVAQLASPQPPYQMEPGYPLMENLILLELSAGQGDRRGVVLGVTDGAIVFSRTICGGPPEDALDDYGPYTIILRGPAYR